MRAYHNMGFNSTIPRSFSAGPLPPTVWRRHNASLMSREAVAWLVMIRSVTTGLIRALLWKCGVLFPAVLQLVPPKSRPSRAQALHSAEGIQWLAPLFYRRRPEWASVQHLQIPAMPCPSTVLRHSPWGGLTWLWVLHPSASAPGISSQPFMEQGKVDETTPCHSPVVSWPWPMQSTALVVLGMCSQHNLYPVPRAEGPVTPQMGHGMTPARCPGMGSLGEQLS